MISAERLRATEFEFLREQLLHDNPAADPTERLNRMMANVDSQGRRSPAEIVHKLPEITNEDAPFTSHIDERDLNNLVQRYTSQRLEHQIHWLRNRARRYSNLERFFRRVPWALFIISVTAALVHFAIDRSSFGAEHPRIVTDLLLLAVGAPIVGLGLRTWRGSQEFGRNHLRYEANADVLERMMAEMSRCSDPAQISSLIFRAERLLERELVAWTTLMLEVEAFA